MGDRVSAQLRCVQGKRVLVVEDSGLTADEIVFGLEDLGCFAVGPVATIDQARDLLQHTQVDCALLDVNLDGVYVFPLAETLLQRRIPFILTTGYGASHLPEQYRAVPQLEKPFSDEELAKALAALFMAATPDGGS